jgi:uncharacterized Zn finger protein (UPF0148 family)
MSAASGIGVRRYTGPACPRCGSDIDRGAIVGSFVSCPVCLRDFEAVVFDPPAPDASVARLAEAGPEGANPCGHHPGNVASDHCSRCGVFMCALCRIDVDGRVLCPACFERMAEARELPVLLAHYRDYSVLQLHLVILGFLIIFVGPVTGPASVYYGLRGLEQRKAMDDSRGRVLAVALFFLAAVQLLGGLWAIASLVRG